MSILEELRGYVGVSHGITFKADSNYWNRTKRPNAARFWHELNKNQANIITHNNSGIPEAMIEAAPQVLRGYIRERLHTPSVRENIKSVGDRSANGVQVVWEFPELTVDQTNVLLKGWGPWNNPRN